MDIFPSIFPPVVAAILVVGHAGAAYAAPSDMPLSRDAAASATQGEAEGQACRTRSFGPSHHGYKRGRASHCAPERQETRTSALENCRLSSRGPRHLALNAKRVVCTKDDASAYSDAGSRNEGGQ